MSSCVCECVYVYVRWYERMGIYVRVCTCSEEGRSVVVMMRTVLPFVVSSPFYGKVRCVFVNCLR